MRPVIALLETGAGQLKRVSNGMRDLRGKLLKILPSERVLLRKWTAKPLHLANLIRKLYEQNNALAVVLSGHSKGGNGVNDVAWCLNHFGVPIYYEGLCDAFGARLGTRPVVVPPNVATAEVFVSTDNLIEGSAVELPDDSPTVLIEHDPLDVPHWKLDEHGPYQAAVLAAVLAALKGG